MLRKAEELHAQLAAIVESSEDAIIGKNLDFNITSWNAGAQKLYGYTAEEIMGKPATILYPPEKLSEETMIRRKLLAGETLSHYETERIAKDGRRIPVSIRISPVRDITGKIVGASDITRDISDRRLAEEALRQDEERFRTVIETAPVAILLVNVAGQIVLMNERVEMMFGYSRDELMGRQVEMLLPEALHGIHEQHREGYMRNPSPRPMGVGRDLQGRRKNGSQFPVEIGLSYTATDQGKLALAFITDITEREQMELVLREQQEFQFQVLQALNDMGEGLLMSQDGKFVYANDAFLNLTHYTTDELGAMDSVVDLVIPEQRDALKVRVEQRQRGQDVPTFYESTLVIKSGQHIAIEALTNNINIAGRQQQLTLVRDISERKHAEIERAQMIEHEQTLRAGAEATNHRLLFLLEASTMLGESLDYTTRFQRLAELIVPRMADWCAIEVLNESGKLERVAVVHSDPAKIELAFEIQRRYPPDENGGSYSVLRSGKATLYADIPDSLLVASAKDEEHLSMMRQLVFKSAMSVPLMISRERGLGVMTLVMAESGRQYSEADLALMEDLARRAAMLIENARLHNETRILNAELEARVARRTAQLETTNKELEAFSYSVSHDLRAPLRAIDGFSRILLRDHVAQLPEAAQRLVEKVRQNTQQMGRLIDDLLTFSRLGRQPMSKHHVDMVSLTQQTLHGLQDELANRTVEVTVGALPSAEADSALIKLVLTNLLSNALKFTRQRDVARIEIGSIQQVGESVYFVRDNGAGFDMAYYDKLFGVFQRLHRAEDFEGTGVGLATVERIIQRHGGRIWAEGALDQGATFYFTLGGNFRETGQDEEEKQDIV